MDFNLPQNLQYCGDIVDAVSGLLYYSHIPSALAVLLLGLFILVKSHYSLLGKILCAISAVFSVWVILNLSIWIFYDKSSLLMAAWSLIEIFSILIFELCLYFTYVFISKKDASLWIKIIFIAPVFLLVAVSNSSFNLYGYDIQECIAIENEMLSTIVFYFKLILSLILCAYAGYNAWILKGKFKKEVLLLSGGILVFIWSFLISGQLAVATEEYIFEAIGLLGMILFVASMGYLIVKFETFNVKLIASQALVITLVGLIAAQFLYVRSSVNQILTAATVLIAIGFGASLVKSVKKEIEHRKKIEILAEELTNANSQLKDNDRQKDELLGIVSHQLAKPITAIKWNLESLLDGDVGALNAEQKESAQTMTAMAADLSDLTSMILDVSRVQLGRMKLDPQPLDLNEFFKEILAIIEPTVLEKGINFVKNIVPKDLPTVLLDKRYTRMTVENLLTNAVKYTPEKGNVTLDVSIQNGTMSCKVTDTGIGIPKAEQGKIFGKMYRASNAQNTHEGNGFGLYVAKGAVEGQGGKIGFTSTEGKGTTFWFNLPVKEA